MVVESSESFISLLAAKALACWNNAFPVKAQQNNEAGQRAQPISIGRGPTWPAEAADDAIFVKDNSKWR